MAEGGCTVAHGELLGRVHCFDKTVEVRMPTFGDLILASIHIENLGNVREHAKLIALSTGLSLKEVHDLQLNDFIKIQKIFNDGITKL